MATLLSLCLAWVGWGLPLAGAATVIESGDDCISVVTWDRDKQPRFVSSFLIEYNTYAGSRTRDLTVIGGEDV